MALPHMLPEAPRVLQAPAHCWSAAYESWSGANAALHGIADTVGQPDLVRWLDSAGGMLTRAGRATDRGVGLMANIGWMQLERMPARRLSRATLDDRLDRGYVYCAYYWRNRRGGRGGHAVVIYGVTQQHVHYMDPGTGQVRAVSIDFFRQQSLIVLGTSLLVQLSQSMEQSFARLG